MPDQVKISYPSRLRFNCFCFVSVILVRVGIFQLHTTFTKCEPFVFMLITHITSTHSPSFPHERCIQFSFINLLFQRQIFHRCTYIRIYVYTVVHCLSWSANTTVNRTLVETKLLVQRNGLRQVRIEGFTTKLLEVGVNGIPRGGRQNRPHHSRVVLIFFFYFITFSNDNYMPQKASSYLQ